MKISIIGAQMNYVGIDHHRQYSHLTIMDEEGQVFRSGRVPNLCTEIEKFLDGLEEVEAVIETVILQISRVKAGPSGKASLDIICRVTRKMHSIDTKKLLVDG